MKAIVAMSGGVDSTVTGWLVKEAGYDVSGVTLLMFDGQEVILPGAEAAAKQLGIPWRYVDCREFFQKDVIEYFTRTYAAGKTPNPCAHCNRVAKFKYLFREMQRAGAEKIFSGHYARTVEVDGQTYIAKGVDPKKDQSYYLALLDAFQVGLMNFPLGGREKTETRDIARSLNLEVAEKKDSQDVCFLEGRDYREFLDERGVRAGREDGPFVLDGNTIGTHKGLINYTVGQRKGLGLSYHEPLFVTGIDAETNTVHLGTKSGASARIVHLVGTNMIDTSRKLFKAKVKLRYRMEEAPCMVEVQPEGRATLMFDEAQFAPAPGQVAAMYDDDRLIGGGFIDRTD